MTTIDQNTALIIVDVQEGLDDLGYYGPRNNPDAERNMARLLAAWRAAGRPVFYIQHLSTDPNSPLRPQSPGSAIKAIVAPQGSEPMITKRVNCAFIGTDLEQRLRAQGIQSVVIVGLTTIHCVSSTARMAGDLGFATTVVSDATATHNCQGADGTIYPARLAHEVALAELRGEFATVVDTEALLA